MAPLSSYTSLNLSLAEATPVLLLSVPSPSPSVCLALYCGNQQSRTIPSSLWIQLVPEQTNENIPRIPPKERHTAEISQVQLEKNC